MQRTIRILSKISVVLLPSFSHPPLVEVEVGCSFQSTKVISNLHIGRWWAEVVDRFPITLDVPSNAQLGPAPPNVGLDTKAWLTSEGSEWLCQVSSNWLGVSWRLRNNEYPRYDRVALEFSKAFESFSRTIQKNLGVQLEVTQTQVRYINLMKLGTEEWDINGFHSVYTNPPYRESNIVGLPTENVLWTERVAPLGTAGVLSIQFVRGGISPTDARPDDDSLLQLIYLEDRPVQAPNLLSWMMDSHQRGHHEIVTRFAESTPVLLHETWGRDVF